MARRRLEIDLDALSAQLKQARLEKGWTLEELSHELRDRGFPTSQNKLWRMENNPPRRVDTELLLWLEKTLEVELLSPGDKRQVLIEDVVELIDAFIAAGRHGEPLPSSPKTGLGEIHRKLEELLAEAS